MYVSFALLSHFGSSLIQTFYQKKEVPKIQSVKRITPIRGKNAMYGFEDEQPIPKQASLKEYFGIPEKKD